MPRRDPTQGSPRPRAARFGLRLVLLWCTIASGATLAEQDSPRASPTASKLAAEDPLQRRAAVHAIADQGGPQAVELLTARLEEESDDELRRVIHDALLRVSLDEHQLGRLLAEGERPATRAFAAHSLGHHHSLGAAAALTAAIRDPDPNVRREVYEALGSCGDRTAIQELIKAAVRETSPPLREQAELAAQRLASTSGRPRDVMVAISMLQGGSPDDRLWAVGVLSESKDWRALQVLLDTARDAPPEIRREAIKALGLLGDHRAVPPLHELLESTTGRTRHYVIGALALLGDESSLEPLRRLVEDPDPACRVLAIRALSALEVVGVVEGLLPALQDSEEPVRTEAIHALGRYREPAAIAGLITALNDPSPFLRAEAARLLGASEADGAAEALMGCLDDRDPLVRLTAAEGLAQLAHEPALPEIERLAERTRDDGEREAYQGVAERLSGASASP